MRKTKRIIDPELTLVPYYSNERAALPWYQDPPAVQTGGRPGRGL